MAKTSLSLGREYNALLSKMQAAGPAAFCNFVAEAYKLHREHSLLNPVFETERGSSNFDFFVEFARRCGVSPNWLAQIMLGSWHKPHTEVVSAIGAGVGCCPEQLDQLQKLVNQLDCTSLPRQSQITGIFWDQDLEREVAARVDTAAFTAYREMTKQSKSPRKRRKQRPQASWTAAKPAEKKTSKREHNLTAEGRQQLSKSMKSHWDYLRAIRSALVQVVNQEAPTSRLLGSADPAKVVDRRLSEIARRSGVELEILNDLWEKEPNKLLRRRLLDAIRRGLADFLPATALSELSQLSNH